MTVIHSEGRVVRVRNASEAAVREAVTEVTRALEDLNWINLSTDWRAANGNDDSQLDRTRLLPRVRMYRRRNPLAKNAAGLLPHYVLGQGISVRAENKKVVARLIDEHMQDPANQAALYSHAAMKKFLDDVWTDGEVLLVLYPDEDAGTVTVSTIDPIFLEDVIPDPKNRLIPRWYKIKKPKVAYDWKAGQPDIDDTGQFVYYRDWQNDDDAFAPPAKMQEKGLIYHVWIEKRGKHGESQLIAAMDWLKAHREFMEDRSTINRAAAQVSWKKKRKGGPNDVANEVARIRSTLTQSLASYEGNPPPSSGATIVENEGSSLEWVKTDTGGPAATADERILRMMTGAGMGGIPNHYQGDEAQANLATATAMELPLLKNYQDWQQFTRDTLSNVLDFMLTTANAAGRVGERDDSRKYADRVTTPQAIATMPEQQGGPGTPMPAQESIVILNREAFEQLDPSIQPATFAGVKLVMIPKQASAVNTQIGNDSSGPVSWYIDIDFPPIVQKDLQALTNALKVLFELLPSENIESQKLVVELYLNALGVNDVDQEMERLFPADMVAVLVPKQPPLLQAPAPDGSTPTPQQAAVSKPPMKQLGPGQTKESDADDPAVASLAEHRVRRLLRIAADVDRAAEPDELAVAVGQSQRVEEALAELAASRVVDQAAMGRIAEAIAARPIITGPTTVAAPDLAPVAAAVERISAAQGTAVDRIAEAIEKQPPVTIAEGAVEVHVHAPVNVTPQPAPARKRGRVTRETTFITDARDKIIGKTEVEREDD